jgi:Replication-relaxation
MIAELTRALCVDLCLTEGQLLRHHGILLAQLPTGFQVTHADLGNTAETTRRTGVALVTLYQLGISPMHLRHFAITAEARRVLGASLEDWTAVRVQGQTYLPDAIWRNGQQRWAIEVDTASYRPEKVKEKIRRFDTEFDGQLWFTSSKRRADSLRLRYGLEAVVVDWL